jgi:NAD(P)-dependent dehydrogenase (short-subunit alcohol dehydrogenase family)
MKIEGSVALVTGANRGLGAAFARGLLAGGAAKVYAAARDPASGELPGALPLRLDITRAGDIAAAARACRDVTLLVNNAGVASSANVLTATRAALDTDFRTNVYGTLAVVKAFVPVLARARGGATIVNVLSLASLGSVPTMGGYSASKAAAYSMTQSLRPELKGKHIEILAALPGPIDTEMVKDLQLPKASPAEVAKGVLAGVERGEEDIFPDPMARQMGALWSKSPKEFERAFAGF